MKLVKGEMPYPPMVVEISYSEAMAMRTEIIAAKVDASADSEQALSKLWGLIDEYEENL